MTKKQFEIGDMVRVDGTINTAKVIKADDSYAQVQFEDGSKVWFTQKMGKESGAGKTRSIRKTSEQELVRIAESIAEGEARKKIAQDKRDHNDAIDEAREKEWFRRFCNFEGVENLNILSITKIGEMEVVVLSSTTQDRWHRDESNPINVYTVVMSPGEGYDYEASWEARVRARESGDTSEEILDVYFLGWTAQGTWMNKKSSGTLGQSGVVFRTKEGALFSVLGRQLVVEPTAAELGLAYQR